MLAEARSRLVDHVFIRTGSKEETRRGGRLQSSKAWPQSQTSSSTAVPHKGCITSLKECHYLGIKYMTQWWTCLFQTMTGPLVQNLSRPHKRVAGQSVKFSKILSQNTNKKQEQGSQA